MGFEADGGEMLKKIRAEMDILKITIANHEKRIEKLERP